MVEISEPRVHRPHRRGGGCTNCGDCRSAGWLDHPLDPGRHPQAVGLASRLFGDKRVNLYTPGQMEALFGRIENELASAR